MIILHQALGRIKNTVNHESERHWSDQHKGVPASQLTSPTIGEYANYGIGKRIADQCKHNCKPDKRIRQTNDLVVKNGDKGIEEPHVYGFCNGP